MRTAVVGESPRPRLLILDFGQHGEELEEILRPLFPSIRLSSSSRLNQIRQQELDVVICYESIPRLFEHIFCLVIDPNNAGLCFRRTGGHSYEIQSNQYTVSTEFIIPSQLPPDIKNLVVENLIPIVRSQDRNRYWKVTFDNGVSVPAEQDRLKPFLTDADGQVLAGRFERPSGHAETWVLPAEVSLPGWIAAAVRHWQTLAPDRFPEHVSWPSRTHWMTLEERQTQEARVNETTGFEELQRTHKVRMVTLDGAAENFRRAADEGPRRLLTEQGDELVDAVTVALEEIGFEVRQMDREIQNRAAKLEDLQVTVPNVEWEALAEVRGYGSGAKTNDLIRLERFVTHFVLRMGRRPGAVWYIVNQFIRTDPDTRQRPLSGASEDIQTFAEGGGLVIDTKDLFLLWNAVSSNTLSASDAISMLRESSVVFQFVLPESEADGAADVMDDG